MCAWHTQNVKRKNVRWKSDIVFSILNLSMNTESNIPGPPLHMIRKAFVNTQIIPLSNAKLVISLEKMGISACCGTMYSPKKVALRSGVVDGRLCCSDTPKQD